MQVYLYTCIKIYISKSLHIHTLYRCISLKCIYKFIFAYMYTFHTFILYIMKVYKKYILLHYKHTHTHTHIYIYIYIYIYFKTYKLL